MLKFAPHHLFKLIGIGKGIMELTEKMSNPDAVDRKITTPAENGTDFYLVVLKVGFVKKEDAEMFYQLDEKLDKAIGEI